MSAYLKKTISALTGEIAGASNFGSGHPQPPFDDISAFVLDQLDRMPAVLGIGIKILTALFGAGLSFPQPASQTEQSGGMNSHPQLLRRIEAWRKSQLGICRNVMKFYSSLVVLSLYSRAEADHSKDAL